MDPYQFLKSLPAVLGVAGFFAYIWFGQTKIGGELLQSIVTKLRAEPNFDPVKYGTLTPTKLSRLVESDERIRGAVNNGDRQLLKLLILLQYLLTGSVLLVCAILTRAQFAGAFGVVLPSRVNNGKARQETLQVQPQMAFGHRLAPPVLGPVQTGSD